MSPLPESKKVKKVTIGPWRYMESSGGAWYIYPAGGGQPIKPKVKVSKRGTASEHAIALFLAAAPDMAEALQAFVNAARDGEIELPVKQALAALLKAGL